MKFSGDATQLLVGIWKSIEQAGGRPNINSVARAARTLGASFTDKTARDILLPLCGLSSGLSSDASPKSRRQIRAQTPTSRRLFEDFSTAQKANDLADEYALKKKARQMTEEAAEEFTPEQRAANLQRFKSMFRDVTHRRTSAGAT